MRKQTRIINAEKIPVLTLKESVGNFSSYSVSVFKDYLGKNQTINSTSKGKQIPAATIKLGVAVISLKKQMARPIIPNIITARVPFPMPKTNP